LIAHFGDLIPVPRAPSWRNSENVVPIFIGRGAPDFPYFTARYAAPEPKIQFCLVGASKQSGENRHRVQMAWQLTMSVRSSNNNCHKS
jgi:hypothetical protein